MSSSQSYISMTVYNVNLHQSSKVSLVWDILGLFMLREEEGSCLILSLLPPQHEQFCLPCQFLRWKLSRPPGRLAAPSPTDSRAGNISKAAWKTYWKWQNDILKIIFLLFLNLCRIVRQYFCGPNGVNLIDKELPLEENFFLCLLTGVLILGAYSSSALPIDPLLDQKSGKSQGKKTSLHTVSTVQFIKQPASFLAV